METKSDYVAWSLMIGWAGCIALLCDNIGWTVICFSISQFLGAKAHFAKDL